MPAKNTKTSVSVVVPAFNSEKTIEKCIRSLIGQDYPKNLYEIIVVDNGSTDATNIILGKRLKDLIVLKEPVKGSYRARNTGILHASGEIILFIDSDCIADKSWIKSLISSFENFDKAKVVGGPIRSLSKGSLLQKYCDVFCHSQEYYSRIMKFATSNMGVRKKCIIEAGLFDGSLFSGGDFELCSRMIKHETETVYNPSALVYTQYSNSFWIFLKKSFFYGRGISIIREKTKDDFYVKKIGYPGLITRHGLVFTFFKLLQDLSFYSGLIFGSLSRRLLDPYKILRPKEVESTKQIS